MLADVDVLIVGVGGLYYFVESYLFVYYIVIDNYVLVESVFLYLKEKGVNCFVFYGLLELSGKCWVIECEYVFC